MADNTVVLLRNTGQIPRNVSKGYDWYVEAVTETHKPRRLIGRVNIERAGHKARLIGYNTNRVARNARKPDYDISCKLLMNFKEIPIVDNFLYNCFYVVCLVWRIRNHLV